MSLAAVVSLMLVLIMPDGQTKRMFIEQPSLFACFEETQKFMQHKPEEFKAIAVGAGCVHHPSSTIEGSGMVDKRNIQDRQAARRGGRRRPCAGDRTTAA